MNSNTALQILAIGSLLLILLSLLGLVWFHAKLIYRFDQTVGTAEMAGMPGLTIGSFTAEDGNRVRVWLVAPKADAPVILFFTGNFGATAPAARRLLPFVALGYGIAVLEYRGSGGAVGTPSETVLNADARALYDQLDAVLGQPVPSDRRILHGFSLGSGIAVRLAGVRDAAGVVLESPFASLTDYFTRKYRGLPMRWLMWSDRYDAANQIGQLTVPVLLLRGDLDTAIPTYSFARLAASAPPGTAIRNYAAGGHSDLAKHGATADILAFYRAIIPGAP